jgi:hypothetical protein
MNPDRCWVYDRHRQRMCRNKRYSGHVCRRHLIEQLRKYETDNPGLAHYLEYRHLLTQDTATAVATKEDPNV